MGKEEEKTGDVEEDRSIRLEVEGEERTEGEEGMEFGRAWEKVVVGRRKEEDATIAEEGEEEEEEEKDAS